LDEAPLSRAEEESRYGLSQFQLMWRKFIRSRMAIGGGIAILLFYLVAIFANLIAPYGGDQRFVEYLYAPPMGPRFDPQIGLYVNGLEKKVDLDTTHDIQADPSAKSHTLLCPTNLADGAIRRTSISMG
jgi:peptide/nickel transport system permease protein